MKTRMEKYHRETREVPKREEKNSFLYDEIYVEKKEPTSNITLIDNVNEIDINKIKEMINSRETYKKSREYSNIIGENAEKKETVDYKYEEPEIKDYDINELIKKKKDGTEEDEEKIRKISNTQYDILKGLTITKETDFFEQEKDLSQLIKTITNKDDKTIDLFSELKANDDEDSSTPALLSRQLESKVSQNTFEFEKGDFEDLNAVSKKDKSLTTKITLIFLISIAVLIGVFFLISQYVTNAS